MSVGTFPTTTTGLVGAILPVPLLIACFLWLDRYEPSPTWILAVSFLWGAGVATSGAILVNSQAADLLDRAGRPDGLVAVLVAPVIEEALKAAFPLLLFVFYRKAFTGVIDGVVAPQDTFRSLHLAEVTRYYTDLAVPRGAYPSRAMSSKRWERLTAAQRAVLEESVAVWEGALADENRRAQQEGWRYALAEGIVEVPISAEDQAKFDAIYAREAERAAARLSRYGIDGERVLALARRSVGADGRVECRRDSP